jgi:hypothetical protein
MGSGVISKEAKAPPCEPKKLCCTVEPISYRVRSRRHSEIFKKKSRRMSFDEYESIIIAAISNETVRAILKGELQEKAFGKFIDEFHADDGHGKIMYEYVVNIEKCKRQFDDTRVIHEEFLKLYEYFKALSAKFSATDPEHPAVVIFETLQCNDRVDFLTYLELRKLMIKSQADVIGIIAPILANFVMSPFYKKKADVPPTKSPAPTIERKKMKKPSVTFEEDDDDDDENEYSENEMTEEESTSYRNNSLRNDSLDEMLEAFPPLREHDEEATGGAADDVMKRINFSWMKAEESAHKALVARFEEARMLGFELEISEPCSPVAGMSPRAYQAIPFAFDI